MGRHELWVELADRPGNLAAVAADLASCGANILHLDVHAGSESTVVDRLVVQVPDERSHDLAAAAARCGATLLHLDDADPHALVDDVVRALDTAVSLVASARPDAAVEAIRRLIPVDDVRVETVTAAAAPPGSPIAEALARGVTKIERGWDGPAPAGPATGDEPWLAVVPHDHDGGQAIAVLTRRGPRFTATEVARCRAVLRLAAQIAASPAGPVPRPVVPAPAGSLRRPPTTLERLIVLTDGGLVRLRHLGPGDREALLAHHERCSFLVGVAGGEVAAGLLGDDGRHRVALVALVGTDIVGVGRYDVDPVGRDAEVVVAVEDRHQGRGVGTLLVGELAVLATNGDVRRLRAMTGHGRDEPLARTFRRAGLAFRSRRDGDAVVLESGLPQDMSATAST
jgi:GNAT superfamily N-acetyltransferase